MSEIAQTMAAAAGVLGVTPNVVKFAKERGCKAFKQGGRVDVDTLKAWLLENADALKNAAPEQSLKDQKTIEEIRKLKLANDIKEGRYTLTADAEAVVEEQARECQRVLYQMPDRLAPDLAGLGPVEIAARLNKAIDEAMECLGNK